MLGFMNERLIPGNTTVYEGDNVELICETKRVPSWYYNGSIIKNSKFANMVHYQSYNRIIIMRVQHKFKGIYTCIGTDNKDQYFSAEMYLHIIGS